MATPGSKPTQPRRDRRSSATVKPSCPDAGTGSPSGVECATGANANVDARPCAPAQVEGDRGRLAADSPPSGVAARVSTAVAPPGHDTDDPGGFLRHYHYQGPPGSYDECRQADGRLRPAWRRFLDRLAEVGPVEFQRRWEQARKQVRENAVTFNPYADGPDQERPWELDPLPLLLPETEWRGIERAMIQRAELLDAVLRDCHGSQRLLADGILPPALVFGQERYLRPSRSLPPPGGRWLHLYAADLARSSDGQWWVVADRTDAPSGLGYALETRIVTARMLPEAAHETRLLRYAGFFREWREHLVSLAPAHRDQPRIVALTPGSGDPGFFEHSYLARYLGITLAQPADLTVRAQRVYLKTLEGLEQVDVIVRHIDEVLADPLELREDSECGVAGLLQAARAGRVVVVNPPGTGLADAPGMMAFLGPACEHLRGESLRMPSVATWWCGQADARARVIKLRDRLILRRALNAGHQTPLPPGAAAADRRVLERLLRSAPAEFAAQEQVAMSTAPSWLDHKAVPLPVTVRVFVIATAAGYRVLPGGLARPVPDNGSHPGHARLLDQPGSLSKDLWVLSDSPLPAHLPAAGRGGAVALRRTTGDLPSRVADNLYWIGRYAERSESAARMLRAILTRVTSERGWDALPMVRPLIGTLHQLGHLQKWSGGMTPVGLLRGGVLDRDRPGSVTALTQRLRQLVAASRDNLSQDTWRLVQHLVHTLDQGVREARLADLVPVLDRVIALHAGLSGMAMENTTRTLGWHFLDIGRRLERALALVALAQPVVDPARPLPPGALDLLLEVADSAITYRIRYYLNARTLPVLDLLLCDPANPRGLAFQLEAIERHFTALPAERHSGLLSEGRKVVVEGLSFLQLEELVARDTDQRQQILQRLHGFLGRMQQRLPVLSDYLTSQYFSLLEPERGRRSEPRVSHEEPEKEGS